MNESKHGGDWAGFEEEFGKDPLDFSMNVNPLGIPEGVAKAITDAGKKADRYPDPECRRLRKALSEHEGVPREWICCGNGAADLIDRIALAFYEGDMQHGSCAIITAPTFSEYEEALRRCRWRVERLELAEEDGFEITDEKVAELEKRLGENREERKMVFLCEPNNPTGQVSDPSILEAIVKLCHSNGVLLVVDECFNGFLEDPEKHSLKTFLGDYPDLVILRAFTKFYGMAGVRLGYCLCSNQKKLEVIRGAGQPWNVSFIAEEAGIAALKEKEYVDETAALIGRERVRLKDSLERIGISKVYGEANYILFRLPREGMLPDEFSEAMRREGILVRDCRNYPGLEKGWFRVAVKKEEENDRLIRALEGLR